MVAAGIGGTQDGALRGELHITSQEGWLRVVEGHKGKASKGHARWRSREGRACTHIEGPVRERPVGGT